MNVVGWVDSYTNELRVETRPEGGLYISWLADGHKVADFSPDTAENLIEALARVIALTKASGAPLTAPRASVITNRR